MIFRRNRNIKYIPPTVIEESNRTITGSTRVFGTILFFSIIILYNFSGRLGSFIPFGNYLWIIPIIILVSYVIKVSSKVNKSLQEKGTDVATEYNKYGDAKLFESATRNGDLKLFDLKKIILFPILILFVFFGPIVGILSLHLVFFSGLTQFLPFGIIGIVIGFGATFLFFFEDKRILNEAKRRNEFVDMAQKRWNLSKATYILVVLISLGVASFLIHADKNFMRNGVITNNSGEIIYDGR